MKIRILHLRDTKVICGPGKTLIESCKHIDKTQFTLFVGVLVSFFNRKNEYLEVGRKLNLPFLPIYEFGHSNPLDLIYLAWIVVRYKIDIIHSHDVKTDLYAVIISRLLQRKAITTLHGWIVNDTKRKLRFKVNMTVLRKMDKIICVSIKQYDFLLSTGFDPKKIELVNNAIVLDYYNDKKNYLRRKKTKNEFVLGTIGRLSEEKRHEDFIELFKHFKDDSIKGLIIGDGSRYEELDDILKRNNLDTKVQLLGYKKDIKPYLANMDIFVLTSSTEGIPNVILEAFAYGIPVISTAVGGVPEIVTHNKDGFLIEVGDMKKAAEYVIQLKENPRLRKEVVKLAKEKLKNKFIFQDRIKKIQNIYLKS